MNLSELGKVSKYIRGITFKPTDVVEPNSPGSVVCMRTKNVQRNLDASDLIAVPHQFVKRREQYLCEGDLLVSSANSWNLVGKTCFVDKLSYPATAGGFISIVRPLTDKVDPRYLYYWLSSDKTQHYVRLCGRQTTNISNLNREQFLKIKLPLPPIAEQRRIAAILDKADAIRRKRKQAIQYTEELLRATFLDMFGDPVTNPKGWQVAKVIDYCACIVPGRDKPKSFTGDIPWVTTADLNHLGYTYKSSSDIGLTADEIKQVNARLIPKDSVLLTCVGDLGITSIAGADMVVNQQLHSFQCRNIENIFLMHVLSYQKNFMYQRATQTTVPYMNKTTCNSIPVIYPPLNLQRQFGDFCRRLSASTAQFQHFQEIENLFNSLLQRAFRGEL